MSVPQRPGSVRARWGLPVAVVSLASAAAVVGILVRVACQPEQPQRARPKPPPVATVSADAEPTPSSYEPPPAPAEVVIEIRVTCVPPSSDACTVQVRRTGGKYRQSVPLAELGGELEAHADLLVAAGVAISAAPGTPRPVIVEAIKTAHDYGVAEINLEMPP